MFIWDFVADTVLGQIFDWVYGKIVEFLGEFFSMMNGMGSELFEFVWVQAVVEFFRYFGWALYGVGLVVAVFEAALEYQSGLPQCRWNCINSALTSREASLPALRERPIPKGSAIWPEPRWEP